jgi:predicted nucleic acid-binding protein
MDNLIKIYLDTSVINFLFADDAPELREITVDLFENYISQNKYKSYISDFVLFEIGNTKDSEKKEKLVKVIGDYNLEILNVDKQNKITELANLYLKQGVIPKSSEIDAFHIAISVLNNINYLISWNYKHLANVNKEKRINMINIMQNYLNELRIITPLELLSYED